MIAALSALALAAATVTPSPPAAAAPLVDAARALEAGRTGQARDMIERAVADGSHGPAIDRLLARLALSEARNPEALAQYRALLRDAPADVEALTGAATAALRLGQDHDALSLARTAAAQAGSGWQPFNLLGVLADRRGDPQAAERAYGEALRRAPDEPALLNNAGWSRVLRGDWRGAEPLFARAAQADAGNRKIANNLELVRDALADQLPQRRPGESSDNYAARLNDCGVVARLTGDERRAVAAFARAIDTREHWFERAQNNLDLGRTASR